MGLSEFIDEHGNPKAPPRRIPVQACLAGLGVSIAVEVLVWGALTGVWSAAFSLAGLVLSAAGTFVLGWDVLLAWGDQVLEHQGPFAGRLARSLGSAWLEIGRESEQLAHTIYGLVLLAGGFILQALGVVVTMGAAR